ncbi:MAG: hypothetical protein D6732_05840 [Methanobacteriota archaeon]|nr:MAG: hypothetical protein D6732_05840 [Euryarchaeota archaeon]
MDFLSFSQFNEVLVEKVSHNLSLSDVALFSIMKILDAYNLKTKEQMEIIAAIEENPTHFSKFIPKEIKQNDVKKIEKIVRTELKRK